MNSIIERIEALDVALFDTIPSQTSDEDKRSLLAVQRVTGAKHKKYAYLEIGSHMGGSIQPYLVDGRCTDVYSIDPRPLQPPDDRISSHAARYEGNSTERMLGLLSTIDLNAVSKIQCFNVDASEVEKGRIRNRPRIAFIDGEHTKQAVLSDFRFCSEILSGDGTILFHDFWIVYPAIFEICRALKKQGRHHVPLKLGGSIFSIFFDAEKIHLDPYLASFYRKSWIFMLDFRLKTLLKRVLPGPLWRTARGMRNVIWRR